MVEALEETRSEFIFATEPVLSSLEASIPGSSRFSPLVELDEVEVRKFIHRTTHEFKRSQSLPDTKRNLANMQRSLFPSFLSSTRSHQCFS